MDIENLLFIINGEAADRNSRLEEFGYISGVENFFNLDVVRATLNNSELNELEKQEIVDIIMNGYTKGLASYSEAKA